MQNPELILETIVSDMFAENAYLAQLSGRDDCLVVDPGFDVHRIVERLSERKLTPAAILNTHGHADHIAGNYNKQGAGGDPSQETIKLIGEELDGRDHFELI